MSDRIDPGPGWRLLEAGEVKPRGYEYKSPILGWIEGSGVGTVAIADGFPCRVRAAPRTTKAIATRATVRAVFPDGATIADSIACESGLSVEMMQFEVDRWALSKIHLPESGAKYIMLEIQREGEP
ncbi:MAG: hypothetical protein GX465_19230 [Acidobacteria bacterium]|nr:hypothetical protein [Acidobacteriota bacterium]